MDINIFIKLETVAKEESCLFFYVIHYLKDALSGLKQFLENASPLKMMKNAFYFTLKTLFVLKISKFLSLLFGHLQKQLD